MRHIHREARPYHYPQSLIIRRRPGQDKNPVATIRTCQDLLGCSQQPQHHKMVCLQFLSQDPRRLQLRSMQRFSRKARLRRKCISLKLRNHQRRAPRFGYKVRLPILPLRESRMGSNMHEGLRIQMSTFAACHHSVQSTSVNRRSTAWSRRKQQSIVQCQSVWKGWCRNRSLVLLLQWTKLKHSSMSLPLT